MNYKNAKKKKKEAKRKKVLHRPNAENKIYLINKKTEDPLPPA
jgi:hypothetical protein